MKVRLVSFDLCPFVHRAIIALEEKAVAYQVEYIDLANKPAWFLKVSPRGKVPVLLVDDVPLFESGPIVEFIEDAFPSPPLRSPDPIWRARERAWVNVASDDLFVPLHMVTIAPNEEAAQKPLQQVVTTLRRIEEAIVWREYLSGDGTAFGLADVAMAPGLVRLQLLEAWGRFQFPEDTPLVAAWAARLSVRPSVQRGLPDNFEEKMRAYLRGRQSWLIGEDAGGEAER